MRRVVWECHRHPVRMDVRLGILAALDCWGAMSCATSRRRYEGIYALCCEAAVDVDLTAADLDGAVVRRSSRIVAPRSHPQDS
jgi:hypothetical protein